jgi:DNA mismatch repair protein MSH4
VSLNRQADGPHSFTFQHQIAQGVSDEEHYGLVLAQDCHLPLELLQDADRMAKALVRKASAVQKQSKGNQAATRRSVVVQLSKQLQDLFDSSAFSPADLRERLLSIQQELIASIDDNLPIEMDPEEDPDSDEDMTEEDDLAMTVTELLSDYSAR